MDVSFVIPAKNEAEHIEEVINSIRRFMPANYHWECVVVDNGSTDATGELARKAGAQVLSIQECTIAGARNAGVEKCIGEIIVFLDGDVLLSASWMENFPRAVEKMRKDFRLILGSHCAPPESDNIFLKYWFSNIANAPGAVHLGAAHMIVSRALFLVVDGFNASLKTGEDYDFCVRAKIAGARIENWPELHVIHLGFPQDIVSFLRRERWHGLGDAVSLSSIFRSKVAVMALIFLVIHVILLFSAIFKPFILLPAIITLFVVLLVSAWVKFYYASVVSVLMCVPIFYLYYLGRAWSFFYHQ